MKKTQPACDLFAMHINIFSCISALQDQTGNALGDIHTNDAVNKAIRANLVKEGNEL